MASRTISEIFPEGQNVFFNSGNFVGHYGTVLKVENKSDNPVAIFGFLIHVKLDNGKTVLVEKSEHIQKISR